MKAAQGKQTGLRVPGIPDPPVSKEVAELLPEAHGNHLASWFLGHPGGCDALLCLLLKAVWSAMTPKYKTMTLKYKTMTPKYKICNPGAISSYATSTISLCLLGHIIMIICPPVCEQL